MSPSRSGYDKKKEEGLLLLILAGRLMKRRKKRRSDLGEYHKLVRELDSHEDPFYGYMYFRMSRGQFAEILTLVQPRITKTTTHWRKPISAAGRRGVFAMCILSFPMVLNFRIYVHFDGTA